MFIEFFGDLLFCSRKKNNILAILASYHFASNSFNTLGTKISKTGSFAICEDPNEMSHDAAFHHGLHCLLGQN